MNQLSTHVEAMLPEIILISSTSVDEQSLLATADQLCDVQPARLVDISQIDLTDSAKLLIYLAELASPRQSGSAVDVLRHLPLHVLSFLHFTFLVVTDKHTAGDFRIGGSIKTSSRKCNLDRMVVTLGTGPLLDWMEMLFANSTREATFHYRILLNKIYLHFERVEGLALIFDDHRKVRLEDQSFILERK